jgi:hypothetical protein
VAQLAPIFDEELPQAAIEAAPTPPQLPPPAKPEAEPETPAAPRIVVVERGVK